MDHYKVLQVDRGAEPEVIEKAYKALAMKYHPDKVGQSARSTRRMQELNTAYAVLSNPAARAHYDSGLGDDRSAAQSPRESRTRGQIFMEDGLVGLWFETWSKRDRD